MFEFCLEDAAGFSCHAFEPEELPAAANDEGGGFQDEDADDLGEVDSSQSRLLRVDGRASFSHAHGIRSGS